MIGARPQAQFAQWRAHSPPSGLPTTSFARALIGAASVLVFVSVLVLGGAGSVMRKAVRAKRIPLYETRTRLPPAGHEHEHGHWLAGRHPLALRSAEFPDAP